MTHDDEGCGGGNSGDSKAMTICTEHKELYNSQGFYPQNSQFLDLDAFKQMSYIIDLNHNLTALIN
uniref:Uncharacterized protein n=1 Tax=Tetranychus urticae TaxID=32264 RepID=T1JVH7_TETUR